MSDITSALGLAGMRELTPWQSRQAAMLYWYASLEYLQKFHTILDQVVKGSVDPTLAAPARYLSSRHLRHPQWGLQDAFKVTRPCPFSDFYTLERKVAEQVSQRKRGIYDVTATNEELRKLQEFWVSALQAEHEYQYQQALELINFYSDPIDELFSPSPNPRWKDTSFAYKFPGFALESPSIPKFRIREDINGTSGRPAPCTGVYMAVDDPHASLQFAVAGRKLTDASTFSQVGLDALHALGRDVLWFSDAGMFDFAKGHKMWPEFRKQMEVSGTLYPDLARFAVADHSFDTHPATWHFVEVIPGEYEDVGLAHVDLSLPAPPGIRKAGEHCRQTGYYFSIAHVGSNRFFSEGDVFPALEGTGNETPWQWSDNYMRPINC